MKLIYFFFQISVQEQIKFCAIADYSSVEDTELSFNQGDLVALIKEGDDGWWYCRNLGTNQEGWAPSGYLEINAVDVTDGLCLFCIVVLSITKVGESI